jgi:hypothetical protein
MPWQDHIALCRFVLCHPGISGMSVRVVASFFLLISSHRLPTLSISKPQQQSAMIYRKVASGRSTYLASASIVVHTFRVYTQRHIWDRFHQTSQTIPLLDTSQRV